HRVDLIPEIVDRRPVGDGDHAGLGVDLDLGDVDPRRVGEVARVVERRFFESGLEVGRVVEGDIGGEHDLADALGLVGAGDPEDAGIEGDVVDRRLHQVGGDLL